MLCLHKFMKGGSGNSAEKLKTLMLSSGLRIASVPFIVKAETVGKLTYIYIDEQYYISSLIMHFITMVSIKMLN